MANHQLLDNITHKDLRVRTHYETSIEPSASYTRIFLSEFRDVQNHYPILFQKQDDAAGFDPISLFGFAPQENLFLNDNGWQAGYIPLSIQRKPFLIGFQEKQIDGALREEPVVFIDMDSPRISQASDLRATAVFLPQGGQSEYLARINSILLSVHEGHQQLPAFVAALQEHDLLELISIKVQLDDGSHHELNTLYGIHEEKLNALSAAVLKDLQSKGYLQAIYMCIASLSNLAKLISLKNTTLMLK